MKEKIKLEVEVSRERVADLLCCAFEGGIGYWARIAGYGEPKEPVRILGQHYTDWPLTGGLVAIEETYEDGIGPVRKLDGAAIERGLALFAQEYPQRFANWHSENEDAEDGDVFVQLCLFGEVKYS